MKILTIFLSIDLMCWLPMLLWLLGAFLLGWLFRKLFCEKPKLQAAADEKNALQLDYNAYKDSSQAKYLQLQGDYDASKLQAAKLAPALAKIEELEAALVAVNNKKQDFAGTAAVKDYKAISAFFGSKIVADDLKLVEGIGPKIEQLFHEAGLKTWDSVAKSTPEQLKAILDAAGDHYKMHDPGTWPAQCAMMVNDEWAALKKWQDELMGGKE